MLVSITGATITTHVGADIVSVGGDYSCALDTGRGWRGLLGL